MAELIDHQILGATCDTRDCPAQLRPPFPSENYFERIDFLQDYAARQGWSIWVGRTRRFYCRMHGPRPGHKMRFVAGGA